MVETTSFEIIKDKFYKRIEKDQDFFNYFNCTVEEAEKIAEERADSYLTEVLDELPSICQPVPFVDLSDYDDTSKVLNYKAYKADINLIVELMFTKYMEKDIPLLHAFQVQFAPSDLKYFSPANERDSYMNMMDALHKKNILTISAYNSTDRKTGNKITIDYDSFADSEE